MREMCGQSGETRISCSISISRCREWEGNCVGDNSITGELGVVLSGFNIAISVDYNCCHWFYVEKQDGVFPSFAIVSTAAGSTDIYFHMKLFICHLQ